jgi:hypothetical protein
MRRKLLLVIAAIAAAGGATLGSAAAETKPAWLGQWTRCAPKSPRFTVRMVLSADRITQIYWSKGKEMARSVVEVRYKVAGERITALILKTFKKDGSVRKSYEDAVGKIYYEFRWKSADSTVLTYVANKTPTKPRRALPEPYIYKRKC